MDLYMVLINSGELSVERYLQPFFTIGFMNYITSLLVLFCNDLNGQIPNPAFIPACMAATKSAVLQSGVGQSVDTFVQTKQNYYQARVLEVTGQKPWAVAAVTYMLYTKKISLATPVRPFVDQLKVEISETSQTVNLVWNF